MPILIRERGDYLPYFQCLANMLSLKDWGIYISDNEPDRCTSAAEVECIEGRKRALIFLSDCYLKESESEQRHVAVHELIHFHHAHQSHLMKKWLSDDAYDAYVLADEDAIDALADAIAPLMPLPSKILGKLGAKPKSAKKRNQ